MIKESESSKLGDAPGGSPLHISRRLKRLSLGMPKASPSSSTTLSGSSPETIFLFHHILCALLGASVCFCFLFCLNKMDPSIHFMGERHAPLQHMDKYVLSFYSQYSWRSFFFVKLLYGWNWKMIHVVIAINVLGNVILGNCCAHV